MALIQCIDMYIGATKQGILWSVSSNRREVRAFIDSFLLTLECFDNGTFKLTKWDDNGRVTDKLYPGNVDSSDNKKLYDLFEAILEHNEELKNHFDSLYYEKENKVISLYRLLNCMADMHDSSFEITEKTERLCVYDEKDTCFVEPVFSQQPTSSGYTDLSEADVVVISAPGATGKSTLTKYISFKNAVPVYDLAKEEPVGSNTLFGLLFKAVAPQDLSSFILGLKDKRTSLIIDALDEAYSKTKHSAYESFLKDIINLGKDSKGLPFILLGRPSILEFSILFLEEMGMKVCCLQIEPFIKDAALDFVTKRVFKKSFAPPECTYYKPLCNYLLNTIEGFFANASDINREQSQRFIGYAPVLMAVSQLLNEKKDYHQILQTLQKDDSQNMRLLLDVVEYILDREKQKVENQFKSIIEDRKDDDKKAILDRVYSRKEQCARVIKKLLKSKFQFELVSGDANLNLSYEACVASFLDEHPFLCNNAFQNIVFESYLISFLINDQEYTDDVMNYIYMIEQEQSKDMSYYLLYGIFEAFSKRESIKSVDYRLLPYLMLSYQSLDRGRDKSYFEWLADDVAINEEVVSSRVYFSRENSSDDSIWEITLKKDSIVKLGKFVSNVTVDIPNPIVFDGNHVELSGDVSISSNKIEILTDDMVLSKQLPNDNIILQAKYFSCTPSSGNMPQLTNTSKAKFGILTSSDLYYPYVDYRRNLPENITKDDDVFFLYQKIRRTMLLFRPNRGSLSISQSKINSRIAKSKEGKAIVDALISTGVIIENSNGLYYIDYDKEAEVLGSKYDDLRACIIVPKMEMFIRNEVMPKL